MPNRDELGRFVKGHSLGGRPEKAREEKYLERFQKAVTLADFERVVKTVVKAAQDGDVQAAKLLLSYAIGNPTQLVEATVDQRTLSLDVVQVIDNVYGVDS
jgi:hypothetical protein